MTTTASMKAGAAFLAGVIVALGGALVYFKVVDSHQKPSIQVMAVEPPTSATVPDISTPAPAPIPDPAPKPVETPAKPVKVKPVLTAAHATSRPVSLAVSRAKAPREPEPLPQQDPPPPPESIDAVPAPVVNTPVAAAPVIPPPPQPHTVTIPAGTSVAVRLTEKLSTEHNYSGDTFRATLDTPIVMDGFIIADRGAKVLGRIVRAQKPGKFEGMAELSLTLTEISTTDGQRLRVETNESLRKGPSNTSEEVLKMGTGAALGAIIGAIAGGGKGAAIGAGAGGAAGTGAVLLGRGKPAVIENETRLTFSLSNPTTITEQLN